MRHYWRQSDSWLLFLAVCGVLLLVVAGHAHRAGRSSQAKLERTARVVTTLGLTDLCLATETLYTRHPSQADRHAPFQTHPLCLEHFPSGAIIQPPQR